MEERWMVRAKRADFQAVAQAYGIDPVVARLMRNRDVYTQEDQENGGAEADRRIRKFLYGGMDDLYDPSEMKHMDVAAALIGRAVAEGTKIRIIGDYDIDGIISSYILRTGLSELGADADVRIPERIRDGYGLNENLIREADADGRQLILTCDNGIAAAKEIALAKELGMQVVVTDHHQVPVSGEGDPILPPADAVVDPHQPGETYPYHGLCGAGVAWKLICRLYDLCGVPQAQQKKEALLEYTAIATIGDVMELTDENRIIVREGLKRLHRTKNPGLLALIAQNQLEPEQIDVYHVGFIIGPCLNASGRLDTAMRALQLLCAENAEEAAKLAAELVALNEERKTMTARWTEEASEMVRTTELGRDRVLVVFLPECHESIAGIIAGRLRENFGKPAFVLTRAEDGVKGSGRSIEAYSMYEELCRCSGYLTKFGGHPMAAGISLKEEQVDAFRRALNENCTLTTEDLIPKVMIDIAMPTGYVSEKLLQDLEILKPFGNGNPKPIFAEQNLQVAGARVFGKNRNVCKMQLIGAAGSRIQAVYFGEADAFVSYTKAHDRISVIYYPSMDTYMGRNQLQAVITSYR